MKYLLPILLAALAPLSPLHGEEAAALQQEAPPRWLFLGDDENLKEKIAECRQILLVCVYQTALEEVNPPFADVVLSATVVEPFKGSHVTGEKITLRFSTDSLPRDAEERTKFIEAAAAKNLGSLKIAFLRGEKSAAHSCEWLDVAPHSPEMVAFVKEHKEAKPEK